MSPVLAEMLASREVPTPDGRVLPLHTNIPELECRVIAGWVRERSPRRLLEVGLAYGISTLAVLGALEEGGSLDSVAYTSIDPFQSSQWDGAGMHALERAGYGHAVTLHEERSETCLPRLLTEGLRLDFALVDGWHTFDHALVDFYYINRMLEVGGIVVFDDVHLPALLKLVRHIENYPAYRRMPPPADLANVREARVRRMAIIQPFRVSALDMVAEDERAWDWHADF